MLVSGHYGAGNIGDEAISVALARLVRDSDIDVDMVILSHSPLDTERICEVRAIPHPAFVARGLANLRVMIKEVKNADVVWIGGGGIFQDEFNLRTIPKYCLPAIISAWVGKPYILYAVGVGPLSSDYARRLTRLVARGAAGVTVRDNASQRLLANLGVISSEIVPDPATYLRAANFTRIKWVTELIEAELKDEEFVFLSLRAIWHMPSKKGPGLTWLSSAAISELIKRLKEGLAGIDCKVVIAPACLAQDSEIGSKMADAIGERAILLNKELETDAWLHLIEAASLVVSMPLHPALLACANSTPAFTIAYDSKVRQQMEIWGLDRYVVGLDEFGRIPECLMALWASRHEEGLRLSDIGKVIQRDVVAAFASSLTPRADSKTQRRLAVSLAIMILFAWIPELIRRKFARSSIERV